MNQKRSRRTRKLLPILVPIVIAAILASTVSAASGQESTEFDTSHRGELFFAPTAKLPRECRGLFAAITCRPDPDFELALEQEYWTIVGNGQNDRMGTWQWKAAHYLLLARKLPADTRGRIETLKAFGYVAEFVKDPLLDPTSLPDIGAALFWAEAANRHNPTPNLQTIHNYLKAYANYALGNRKDGDRFIANLYQINETHGQIAGSEGELVGAMGQLLLTDKKSVRTGLRTLDNCRTAACQRESALAPYKEVGMQIAIAEGYARLGNRKKMEAAFDRARAYATANDHPYPELIEQQYDELLDAIEAWNNKPKARIGAIKLPLPPSTGVAACQTCHATGRQIADVYRGEPAPLPSASFD